MVNEEDWGFLEFISSACRAKIKRLLAGHGALGLAKGSRPPALELLGFLGLLLPLGKDLGVLGGGQPVLLSPPPLKGKPVPLPLKHHRGDKTLHLGSGELLLLSILKGEWPLDDVLANIVLLGQVEQLPNLAGTLGSQPARDGVVGQSGNLSLSLLDDGHGQDGEVAVDDAPADRLPLALSILARAVAGGALLQQQPHPAVGQDTLLHGEALLVVASSDAENVALELITKGIGLNLLAHPLLIERTNLQLISNLDQLLASRGRVRQIDLHPHSLKKCYQAV